MLLAVLAVLAPSVFSEAHPPLTWKKCSRTGCIPVHGFIVADIGSRSTPDSSINYADEIGVTTNGDTLSQRLGSEYNGKTNIGSRLYLLGEDEQHYELFNFNGKELAYDVDLSQITCGVDAALYSAEIPVAGGDIGAAYGDGYCDAGFIGGTGCASFDFQEGNSEALIFRAQPCPHDGQAKSPGQCDSPGCGFNAYRFGDKDFWGVTLNPALKVTVVTQFVATSATLTEVRRLYVQGGRVFKNPTVEFDKIEYNAITDDFCRAAGNPVNDWHTLAHLGESFARGHVLVFSLWDSDDMSWLDGGDEGPCESLSRDSIESIFPKMTVTWSNIRFGDLDTTY
jgi:hypothetical protein